MGGCHGSRHQRYRRGLAVFDDAYDREKWRGYVVAVMALNGLTS